KIYSSTQSPTSVQRVTAKILDLPMHQIEVDVLRLGGAFGGKEDQATHWAALAALGTHKLNRPVKLVLSRMDDIKMTGKRHPYSSDFKIGLSNEGKILAYEVTFYQNAGASADLSPAILERTLFHVTNSYSIPNVKATGISCRTNLPPNTAFRGFGGPQAMFVIESAIYEAASKMGMSADKIQKMNLIDNGEKFYYGQSIENAQAINSWNRAESKYELGKINNDADQFNKLNDRYKKGVSLMPICFGISFTSSFLNQASALVHVYTDGSVGISTAAVEMGQGVNAKLREISAKIFAINIEKIKTETTNTTRVANTSATAASSGADLNGNAVILACENILARLKSVIIDKLNIPESSEIEIIDERIFVDKKPTKLYWNELIQSAYFNRISLTSQAYYSTPDIHFDREKNQGHPFAYHVFGTAIITVTLDC
ncbi:MAG: molybdopterin-dependent oxidoreductase, partial [Melioribacteraceae bacterium]|nr:molybdopterin-dependent oxidoreductase [Melioribacteraceae bacterium]